VWSDELKILRRFLRDPDGNIWADAYLRHLWNDVQKDLQNRTSVLEGVSTQRVPDIYHCAYQHDWEWRFLPSKYSEFYRCLNRHDSSVFCHTWEVQQLAGIELVTVTSSGSGSDDGYFPPGYLPSGYMPGGYFPGSDEDSESETTFSGSVDATDLGSHFTQPWEAFMGLDPGEEVRLKFPKNLRSLRFIAYDEEPIDSTTRKMVQSCDGSHVTRSGRPIAYYPHEGLDKSYVLYPRPSTVFADEIDGNAGLAFHVEDDSEITSPGTIAVRSGSSDGSGGGVSVDVVGTVDNVFMIFDVVPTDITSEADESDFPQFLRKYIRYGVISRAYDANTDGRIPSLARMWGRRFEMGENVIKRYMRNRSNDRDYRLMTKPGSSRTRRRHPRLPDTYPAV
jgi:hypothetical protein